MTQPIGLFIIKPDGALVGLTETRYDSEGLLQELLARYPDLLAGDQVDPVAPRRWLLITRELGIPDDVEAADRWSIDHLFMDQDAIPTLVEVKRSTDTRIRREVVGQMLDYAANAVLHWPVETIRAAFERRCEQDKKDADKDLRDFLGPESTPDAFWASAKTNLQAGRIRLLFVSDIIPAELRRVVEFLNRQMETAEVLAVEVRQFTGQDLRTLVPRVFGQTAETEQRKGGSARRGKPWDEAGFFAKLTENGDDEAVRVARALFDWARRRMTRIDFGTGLKSASFIPMYEHGDMWFSPFRVASGYRAGFIELPLGGSAMKAAPFDQPDRKLEFVRRLNAIPGVQLAEDLTRFPSIELSALAQKGRLERFLAEADWAVDLVKGLNAGADTSRQDRGSK